MKKILIFTAKWPLTNNEADGGSITVLQLVNALKKNYLVDYLYLQKRTDEVLTKFDGINSFELVDGSFLDYSTYNKTNTNKFDIRLANIPYMNKLIKDRIDNYDYVIIIHCLQAMGLDKVLTAEQLKKVVIFPMFLTRSYALSGDIVSKEYTFKEKAILNAVGTIITPSNIEKADIINQYDVTSDKVFMVPRSIDNVKNCSLRAIKSINHISYVASFKNQKNNLEAIKAIELVKKAKNDIKLHLLGTIQDSNVYQQCVDYVIKHNLQENVVFERLISNDEMLSFYNKIDLAISTSLNETFGRGIFEGLAAGLPSIVYRCIEPVYDFAKECKGIIFVKDYEEMARQIISLLDNSSELTNMSKASIDFCDDFFKDNDLSQKYQLILERKQ